MGGNHRPWGNTGHAETAAELQVIFREVARTAEHAAGRVGEAVSRVLDEAPGFEDEVG